MLPEDIIKDILKSSIEFHQNTGLLATTVYLDAISYESVIYYSDRFFKPTYQIGQDYDNIPTINGMKIYSVNDKMYHVNCC